jgi:hypothetical protein
MINYSLSFAAVVGHERRIAEVAVINKFVINKLRARGECRAFGYRRGRRRGGWSFAAILVFSHKMIGEMFCYILAGINKRGRKDKVRGWFLGIYSISWEVGK